MLNSLDAAQCRQLLENAPVGLLLLDAGGVPRWLNPVMRDWLGEAADDLLGRPPAELPEELQTLLDENPTVKLAGETEDQDLWLLGSSQELAEGGMAQFFTDATALKQLLGERDALRELVDELNVTDAETNMPNRRALYQQLESQVSRSRRYENPLSILIMQFDNLDEFSARFGSATPLLLALRNMLNDQLRWADTIGRLDSGEFLLILPETPLDATRKLAGMLRARLANVIIEGVEAGDFIPHARMGAAQWQKGDDVGLLMLRAREDLDGTRDE
jgi:diguanylate cyclase (GGDEF)-like protein